MNILILHRIPYYKIDYHRGIDHVQHRVVYIGTEENLKNIPEDLPCIKVARAGVGSVEEEVHEYMKSSPLLFDRIISLSEYELMAAAKLREAWRVAGQSVSQTELVRNKLSMKLAVSSCGIRVPHFSSLSELIKKKNFKCAGEIIIKPIDGASSENIITCPNAVAAMRWVKLKKTGIPDIDQELKSLDHFEVEEFIKGDILHFDGLVLNGKIITCLASQYVGNCLDYARGLPLGSVQIEMTNALKKWAQRCVNAVQIQSGSIHLEAINSAKGLVFLEIANRVGGADVVKTFELATGIHLPSTELKLILGERVTITSDATPKHKYGWFVFPGHHIKSGAIKTTNANLFRNHPFILNWYELPEEALCKNRVTYQPNEVPIAGVLKGDNSQEIMKFLQHMFDVIQVRDRDNVLEKVA